MYTVSRDIEITHTLLNDVIEYNEKKKDRYINLMNYYLGKHDIFKRKKGDTLSNNKVMVNHAKYITDISVGYLLGNPVDYQTTDKYNIEPILDIYKKQTINDLDSEIAKAVSIMGMQYEYVYSDENAEPKSCKIDNCNSIIVYDDTVEHKELFGLMYRPIYNGRKLEYYEMIYCDDKVIRKYKSTSKLLTREGEEIPHTFGEVPMICYKNNYEELGDFETVISLIDAYNILQSDRLNDKEQLVDAILCMYGVDFTEDQARMLKGSRMIANIPAEAKMEYLIKTMQESQVDILRQNYAKDIHKISMVPDMSDENFAANSSGVAIRYKLLSFEQNIKNKERNMEKGLIKRFRLYNNFLNSKSKMSIVPNEEVDVVFKRNLPSNDFEISQMINNLTDLVDKETLVGQLSFIKDASEIVELKEKEKEEAFDKYNASGFGILPDANENEEENNDKK